MQNIKKRSSKFSIDLVTPGWIRYRRSSTLESTAWMFGSAVRPDLSRNAQGEDHGATLDSLSEQNWPTRFLFSLHQIHPNSTPPHTSRPHHPRPPLRTISAPLDRRTALILVFFFLSFFEPTHTRLRRPAAGSSAGERLEGPCVCFISIAERHIKLLTAPLLIFF